MNQVLQDRIDDYLDGRLNLEETRRFERDLLKEEAVAAEFREHLLFRDLLDHLSPEQPPPGLVQRIELALTLNAADRSEDRLEKKKTVPGQRFSWLTTGVRAGWGWTGYALAGLAGGSGALKSSIGGVKTISYSLGSLRNPARKKVHALQLQPGILWKSALSYVRRRLFP